MQQTSRSKVAVIPLLLFIVIPIAAFFVLRKYGLIFFALFLNPIGTIINQMFTKYTIRHNNLEIKGLFNNKSIPVDQIIVIENKKSLGFQKILLGIPENYQLLRLSSYEEIRITPQRELIYHPKTQQLYFK